MRGYRIRVGLVLCDGALAERGGHAGKAPSDVGDQDWRDVSTSQKHQGKEKKRNKDTKGCQQHQKLREEHAAVSSLRLQREQSPADSLI